jgi:hypothetical protein
MKEGGVSKEGGIMCREGHIRNGNLDVGVNWKGREVFVDRNQKKETE